MTGHERPLAKRMNVGVSLTLSDGRVYCVRDHAAQLGPHGSRRYVQMGWGRRGGWPGKVPRPTLAKLGPDALATVAAKAEAFVATSPVLAEIVERVQLARGRLYFWRGDDDLLARLTPLSQRTFLLETQTRRGGWSEHGRGLLQMQLRAIEQDEYGTMHGLGGLAPQRGRRKPKDESVAARLHREFGVPLRVASEPRDWYALKRQPVIVEATPDRVLVRFESFGPFGSFGGTVLYAQRESQWACYYIRPNRSASIEAAEAWLAKKNWLEDDGDDDEPSSPPAPRARRKSKP